VFGKFDVQIRKKPTTPPSFLMQGGLELLIKIKYYEYLEFQGKK